MYFDYLIDTTIDVHLYTTCSIVILELCYEFSIIFEISNLQLLKTYFFNIHEIYKLLFADYNEWRV